MDHPQPERAPDRHRRHLLRPRGSPGLPRRWRRRTLSPRSHRPSHGRPRPLHRHPHDIGDSGQRRQQALKEAGYGIAVIQEAPTFCRMLITQAEQETLVDLALDSPPTSRPTITILGPTMAPLELAGRKLLALFSRAEARDFADVYTDNGDPFRSARFAASIEATPHLDHVRTRVRTPGQDGVRERAFQSLTYERLYREQIDDMGDLVVHGEDNAAAEALFSSLEWEVLSRHEFDTRAEARAVVIDWAYGFYNHQRRHSAAGMMSPVAYEQTAATSVRDAA